MKVDYISDLHLDFHVKVNSNEQKYLASTEKFCEDLLPDYPGEVLVVAGDISHYNRQSKYALEFFSKHYERVFYVTGNHDYYLISSKQEKKYAGDSIYREIELYSMLNDNEKVIHLRNFDIHVYKGVKFAGDTNWYSLESIYEKSFFENMSNDSRLIKRMNIAQLSSKSTYEYESKITHESVDVLVTHVPSIQIQSHVKHNSYYCYLNTLEPKAKHHIFGHCHEQSVYEKAGHKFYINTLGYPNEWTQHMDVMDYSRESREKFYKEWAKIKSFEVNEQ